MNMEKFLEEVSAATPTPGGGSVAAMAGAIACSLAEMVCNLTIGKKKYADVEEEMIKLREKMQEKRKKFLELVEEDAKAFDEVMKAYKEKKGIEEALKLAAETPFKTAVEANQLLDNIKLIAEKGNKNSISDAGVATYMAYSSFYSALLNVRINLKYIEDENYKKDMEGKIKEMEKGIENKKEEILKIVRNWL